MHCGSFPPLRHFWRPIISTVDWVNSTYFPMCGLRLLVCLCTHMQNSDLHDSRHQTTKSQMSPLYLHHLGWGWQLQSHLRISADDSWLRWSEVCSVRRRGRTVPWESHVLEVTSPNLWLRCGWMVRLLTRFVEDFLVVGFKDFPDSDDSATGSPTSSY